MKNSLSLCAEHSRPIHRLQLMLPRAAVTPTVPSFQAPALGPWCHALPKVELHAHLHGSIRPATLAELAAGLSLPTPDFLFTGDKTLAQCFAIFALIHQIVTSVQVLRRVIREVLCGFASDRCMYLELRTTPRCLSDGTDMAGYVRTLLEEVEEFERQQGRKQGGMMVRLLLSIDRGSTVEHAMEVARLAAQARQSSRLVVGVDFSGNPTRASFSDFREPLTYARDHGLKVTVHMAEVENDAETDDVLGFRPDRLGHALFLNDGHLSLLRERPIPVELCPSSNMKTLELASHSQHPTLERFLQDRYPFSINTDDCGVFDTSPAKEYEIVAREFGLSAVEVAGLARQAIGHIFESEDVKEQLRQRFDKELERLQQQQMGGQQQVANGQDS